MREGEENLDLWSASTKLTLSLRKQGRHVANCRFVAISVNNVGDAKEEVVNAFRHSLILKDMIPLRHDDYHNVADVFEWFNGVCYCSGNFLLSLAISEELDLHYCRFLRAQKFDLDKTLLMGSEMLNWRKENGVDLIIQLMKQLKFH